MADDLAARLGQKFFVEIDGKRFVDDAPQIARDRITALQAQNRKMVDALIAADALQDALVKHLNAPGGLPREVYATLLTYKTTRAAIAEAAKGEGR